MKYITILILYTLMACQGPLAEFEVMSGEYDRSNSPISFKSNVDLIEGTNYYLENIEDGKVFPIQKISENEMLTIINSFPPHTTLVLALKKGDNAKDLYPKINIVDNDEGIQVTIGNRPLMFYQSEVTGPDGKYPDYYERSGFIHPLYSPNGEILTDGFPIGHTHQNGIFNAWTNTTFKGSKVDFWNRQDELGTVKHIDNISIEEGNLKSQIKTKLSHISMDYGEVLEEEWQIDIYSSDKYFLFDLQSEQVNTSQDTLFLNEYLYGGMAFRGSREWNKDDVDHFTNTWEIVTSEGLANESANHTKAAWVNASGMINGHRAGLAVFSFPDNFRTPQMIRVHPEMPYWVYSPVIEGPFYIAPGQKYISRYRYLSHDGAIDTAEFDRVKADLENPPIVRQIK